MLHNVLKIVVWLSILGITPLQGLYAQKQNLSYTQEDRERQIRMEAKLDAFKESTDKRITELREDMNKRFEQIDKRFEQVDKRFEQVDKRFEQVDKRFEQVDRHFEEQLAVLQLIAGIFTTLTLGVIGFAYWDRRSILRKAREETLSELDRTAASRNQLILEQAVTNAAKYIEKEGRLQDLILALRRLASTDAKLAGVLKEFHLL